MADPIEIVPFDPRWPGLFADLGKQVRFALGSVAVRIDHIGSTAIAGLAAKPIIDLQISVPLLGDELAFVPALRSLGLIDRPDNPERTKRYFREALGTPRAHYHVRQAGSWSEQFALLFRDFLRTHPTERDGYAQLKRSLAQRHRHDREAYVKAKEQPIWEIMFRADQWAKTVGWAAGDSDA